MLLRILVRLHRRPQGAGLVFRQGWSSPYVKKVSARRSGLLQLTWLDGVWTSWKGAAKLMLRGMWIDCKASMAEICAVACQLMSPRAGDRRSNLPVVFAIKPSEYIVLCPVHLGFLFQTLQSKQSVYLYPLTTFCACVL